MSESGALDRNIETPTIDVGRCMRLVRQRCGKSSLSQILEMAALALGPGKITPKDYYYYRLYDDNQFGYFEKKQYIGQPAQRRINPLCNDPEWRAIADDKIVFSHLLHSLGFPVARTLAVYHRNREIGSVPVMRSPEQLGEFLRKGIEYPFFSKPVMGHHSIGTASIKAFDSNSDELLLVNEGKVPLNRYIEDVQYFDDGYMFQEVLHPHDAIEEICGDRIASLRIVVLVNENGPGVFRTAWKIPAGRNHADNFWRPGNILAAVDAETGRVGRAVQGVGPDQVELERHPDTGCPIRGFTVPHWARVKELCLAVATNFSGIRLQAWDVAVCRDGPLLQEVNPGGDYNLPQVATGTGMLDDRFREFLESRASSWNRTVSWSIVKSLTKRPFARMVK